MVLNYSYGDLLVRALEACAAQTFRDFEVVMINNGAIDNTEEVYNSFCEKYPEIRTTYVHVEQNQGAQRGWNEGLKQARGEYVMFNDADDWMDPDCLEKLAQKAKETGADRVTGQARIVLPDGRVSRVYKLAKDPIVPTAGIQCVIFRRSVIFNNALFFPEAAELKSYDYWMTFYYAAKESSSVVLFETIYNYAINERSVVSGFMRPEPGQGKTDNDKICLISLTADLLKQVKDKKLKNEIEYVLVKGVYSSITSAMRHWPAAEATCYHDRVYAHLEAELPDWKKNPLLWPFGNGYKFFTSLCLYGLVWMDRLHAIWLVRLAGKMSGALGFGR